MGSKVLGRALLVGTVSAGLTSLWGSLAVELSAAPLPETGCRQTNALTGIYVQPTLESSSRGILETGQTVRLEIVNSGTGWARVTEPLIGWVEAKYLTPAIACIGLAVAPSALVSQPIPHTPAQTAAPPVSQAVSQVGSSAAASTVTAVCEVLPTEGLVVRSEPTTTGNTAIQTIPKGTYEFQFTSDYVRSHTDEIERDWAYITAPYQGWITIGVVGGQFNLGGKSCG